MSKTSIEWCDHSINPIRARFGDRVGHHCVKVSPGCAACYASRMQRRFGLPPFEVGKRDGVEPFLDEHVLQEPLRRRVPTRYFWCDMSDLFGEWVPDKWIDACFEIMERAPQHTHLVLTKRAQRMRDYLSWRWGEGRIPSRNIWAGVSCENQATAARILLLLQTPAARRFISLEPLLEPVDLVGVGAIPPPDLPYFESGTPLCSDPLCRRAGPHYPREFGCRWGKEPSGPAGLDQVIVGGESGPRARPFRLEWARSVRDQCKAAGVAYFFKQGGTSNRCKHSAKGGCLDCIPEDLRVREMPR